MELTTNEQNVLDYLKRQSDFISPTQVAHEVGGSNEWGYIRQVEWASPICLKLVKKGVAVRSEKGWYKVIKTGQPDA